MNAKKLNSLSREIFSYSTGKNNSVIKVNGANGKTRELNRDKIVSLGRIATCEYFGRMANADKNNPEKYIEKTSDYATFSKNAWEDTVLFCAAQANSVIGKEPYTSMEEVAKDPDLCSDKVFWNALRSITTEVIMPLFPAVTDTITDRLVTFLTGRFGESKLVDIESNDFFVFDDDSWGSVSSKPYQYLYKSQISLTAKPYTAKTKIKWYQDVIDGEAGRYYAAFMRGMANKMYALTMESFKKAVSNTKYLPSGLIFDSFTTAHWNEALMLAEAVNGVGRNNLAAIGTLMGLSQILPTVGESGAIAGIQGEIGTEYMRRGFLANVSGVDLIEAHSAIVPGTQNYNPTLMNLDDSTNKNIYILAKTGYAPMVGLIPDGSPMTITFTPTETADMTIDISMTISCDIQPAFSSKVIKIQA